MKSNFSKVSKSSPFPLGIYYKDKSVCNGWYNQNYSPASALIEVGGTANTLAESNRMMDILAQVINQIRLSGK
ncbi:stage II sporulation protein P [Paenibacillus montanisoli]|uniref:MurNAc-LAA domain-containing protein n=1 Tax=Paenibacillus montanisoli TaxID=2081970 RepID=A0A328U7J8_9BACL|nr:stage II sporulation protein P [Paenibacillus montanisoli]RAP78500.1 hypothetical protein DL346_08795 [Paenibacillus montanisoli]